MNQKSLARVALLDAGALLVAAITTGSAVDTAGYAQQGRREFRVTVAVGGMTNTTNVSTQIQDNTTNGSSGWTNNGSAVVITTNGSGTDIFISTTKRYLRAISTPTAITASYVTSVQMFLENRETTS